MRHLMVMFASLLVVTPPCAEGKTFGHFGIRLSTQFGAIPSAPSSSTISQASMAARAADEQLARQTGVCADAWTERFSSQCPPRSFMALQAYGTVLGLTVPYSSCQPAGCLHAQAQRGEDDLRDEGELLRDAVVMEVAILTEQQPGVSFEKHLTTLRKNHIKEGAAVKAILASLLREASVGERAATTTTMRFFVEMAAYRGFVGPEVDQTWAILDVFIKDEMALEFGRRTSQLLMTRLGPVMAEVGWESNTQAETICQQEGATFDAREETIELCARLSAGIAPEKEVAETEINLACELYTVHQLLDKERTEKVAAVEAVEKVKNEIAAVRLEAATNATRLTSELSDAQQLLNKELAAKAAAATEVEEGKTEIASVRSHAATGMTELSPQLSNAQQLLVQDLAAKDAAVTEVEEVKTEVAAIRFEAATDVTTLSLQLSDVQHLLDNELDDKAAAVEEVTTEIAALRSEAAKNTTALSSRLSDVKQLLHKEFADKTAAVTEVEEMSVIVTDVESALKEAYETNAKPAVELGESKPASSSTCDKMLQEKDADIADLEESCRVESANEGTRQGDPQECPLQREEAMRGWLACTTENEELMDDWEAAVVEVERLRVSVKSLGQEGEAFREAAGKCSASLKKERLAHQQHLAALSGSKVVC